MGYTTKFDGTFNLDRSLDDKTYKFLHLLNITRRTKMKVDLLPKSFGKYGFDSWGEDGEFYVDGHRFCLDFNVPPRTQPGLWCCWGPNVYGTVIEWDGSEKFYNYVEWIQYIIKKVLVPRGYVLNGIVDWNGEKRSDSGQIKVDNNIVYTRLVKKTYEQWSKVDEI